MMKRNKNKVILSSIVVLLPMVIGLLIWNQLPKDVATHFSFNGQPDGYSSKEFAVFVLPLIIFVIHLFCIFAVKPNYTVGIRVPWTLNDQDNWYHTHRFSGKCMVLGGVLLIMLLPFMDMFILFTLALVPGILPIIYSYLYHRKKAR